MVSSFRTYNETGRIRFSDATRFLSIIDEVENLQPHERRETGGWIGSTYSPSQIFPDRTVIEENDLIFMRPTFSLAVGETVTVNIGASNIISANYVINSTTFDPNNFVIGSDYDGGHDFILCRPAEAETEQDTDIGIRVFNDSGSLRFSSRTDIAFIRKILNMEAGTVTPVGDSIITSAVGQRNWDFVQAYPMTTRVFEYVNFVIVQQSVGIFRPLTIRMTVTRQSDGNIRQVLERGTHLQVLEMLFRGTLSIGTITFGGTEDILTLRDRDENLGPGFGMKMYDETGAEIFDSRKIVFRIIHIEAISSSESNSGSFTVSDWTPGDPAAFVMVSESGMAATARREASYTTSTIGGNTTFNWTVTGDTSAVFMVGYIV